MEVAPPEVKGLKDTTGAGDAYLGGMIVGLVHDGLPKTREELRSAIFFNPGAMYIDLVFLDPVSLQ